jgi:hypothetical protein
MVRHSRTSSTCNTFLIFIFTLACCVGSIGQSNPVAQKHAQDGKSAIVQAQADATSASAQGTLGTPIVTSAVLTSTKAGTVLGPNVSATLTVTGSNLTDGYTLGFDKFVPLKTANSGTTGSAAVTLPGNYAPGMSVQFASSANPNVTLSTIPTTVAPAALFTVNPLILKFPDLAIGSTSAVQSVTVTSQALGPRTVNVSAPPGDFAASPNSCDLQPSTSCTISVSFAPKHVGETTTSITFSADGSLPSSVQLSAKGLASCQSQSKDEAHFTPRFWEVLLIVVLYLAGFVVVRWNLVALPSRRLLLAHLDSIDSRRQIWLPSTSIVSDNINKLLDEARALNRKGSILDSLLWTRGQELSGWGYAHEAEAELAGFLPTEVVRAKLESVEEQLRTVPLVGCSGMADRIKAALDGGPQLEPQLERALLEDLSTYIEFLIAAFQVELKDTVGITGNFTASVYQDLANRIIKVFQVQAPSLSNRIEQVLQTASILPNDQITFLLKEAYDILNPQAVTLTEQLKAASQDPNHSADQWKTLWEQVLRYLMAQSALSVRIKEAVHNLPNLPTNRWKALLSEALAIVNDRTDTDFANLISWQNKTLWIVGCGLLLVVALAGVLEHEVLFLVGATGGLLSRLSRSLQRADVPTDYGASWTTLFLSPVAGALAGWSGVLLIILAVQLELLGPLFGKVDWCSPSSPAALGIAFLLGFSERAFDGILSQLDDKVQASQTKNNLIQQQSIKIVSASPLSPAKLNLRYGQPLVAMGGEAPYKWVLASGKLPDGLQLDQGGQISGTPTVQGVFKFMLQVSDRASGSMSQEFVISVS